MLSRWFSRWCHGRDVTAGDARDDTGTFGGTCVVAFPTPLVSCGWGWTPQEDGGLTGGLPKHWVCSCRDPWISLHLPRAPTFLSGLPWTPHWRWVPHFGSAQPQPCHSLTVAVPGSSPGPSPPAPAIAASGGDSPAPVSPSRMRGAHFYLMGSLEAWGGFGNDSCPNDRDLGSDLGLQSPCKPLTFCPKRCVSSGG